MPKMTKNRLVIPLILVSCFLLWQMGIFSPKMIQSVSLTDVIERLHVQAKAEHETMLARQSRTLQAARSEYSRRYKLRPPPGYDKWFDYAVAQGSPIIDEFDSIMEDIKPYRNYLGGSGWNEGRCDLYSPPDEGPAMLHACIKGHRFEVLDNISSEAKLEFADPLEDLISDFVIHLPDMCFEMNMLEEPRIMLPHQDLEGAGTEDVCELRQEYRDLSKQNIWQEAIKSCSETSPARLGSLKKHTTPTASNSLIHDWSAATDLCHLSEPPPTGLIQGPVNMHVGSVAKPVLSPSKLSTFGDIRYPSLLRWRDKGNITEYFQFEVKRHRVGWRGDSTGGWASGNTWQHFQRHRMVSLAQAQAIEGTVPVRKFGEQDLINSTPSLRKRLDIGFTHLVSCEHNSCNAMRKEFRIVTPLVQLQIFANKLVLDMDGDGLSGRFYQLMKSNSAVLKQGILNEWHDARLKPWVHFIPLSMGMLEMPGMLEYLFDTENGNEITKSIAITGRDWTNAALRPEDARVYMYRLLLEYGRRDFTPF